MLKPSEQIRRRAGDLSETLPNGGKQINITCIDQAIMDYLDEQAEEKHSHLGSVCGNDECPMLENKEERENCDKCGADLPPGHPQRV